MRIKPKTITVTVTDIKELKRLSKENKRIAKRWSKNTASYEQSLDAWSDMASKAMQILEDGGIKF